MAKFNSIDFEHLYFRQLADLGHQIAHSHLTDGASERKSFRGIPNSIPNVSLSVNGHNTEQVNISKYLTNLHTHRDYVTLCNNSSSLLPSLGCLVCFCCNKAHFSKGICAVPLSNAFIFIPASHRMVLFSQYFLKIFFNCLHQCLMLIFI